MAADVAEFMEEAPAAPEIETGYAGLNPVERAVSQRRSLRGFLPEPVAQETVERILALAGRAPSGTNMQPWQAWVVTGGARQRLTDAILAARAAPDGEEHRAEFAYYPEVFPEPYRSRRRKVGWDLYGLLGIGKGEFEKTKAQHDRNFSFFDAPVGMIFTIDRLLKIGSWLDYGMYLQNVMVLARGLGYETCPQVAFAQYHKVIRRVLPVPEEQIVVCGMSLGRPDWGRIECSLITEREPVAGYARFFAE